MRKLDRSRLARLGCLLGDGGARALGSRLVQLACAVAVVLLLGVGGAQLAAAADDEARAVPGTREWIVGNGDSWFSMRSRICPVETLREANPSMSSRDLRPGERIASPFVPADQFDRVKRELEQAQEDARVALETAEVEKLAAAELRAGIESRDGELASLQTELDAALASEGNRWLVQWVLAACVVLLAAGLVAAGLAFYSAWRARAVLEERLRESEARYTDLRRSIMDLDVQLQRRMLKLLSWHDSRVLTERQVEEATAPVVEMARRVKERHAG